jgi:hypothetical protein
LLVSDNPPFPFEPSELISPPRFFFFTFILCCSLPPVSLCAWHYSTHHIRRAPDGSTYVRRRAFSFAHYPMTSSNPVHLALLLLFHHTSSFHPTQVPPRPLCLTFASFPHLYSISLHFVIHRSHIFNT